MGVGVSERDVLVFYVYRGWWLGGGESLPDGGGMKQNTWVLFYRDYAREIHIIRSCSYDDKGIADTMKANFVFQKRFVAMVKVELTLPAPNPLVIATVEVV